MEQSYTPSHTVNVWRQLHECERVQHQKKRWHWVWMCENGSSHNFNYFVNQVLRQTRIGSMTYTVCYDVQNTSVLLIFGNDTANWSIKTCALKSRPPYLWNFSCLRQTSEGAPYTLKCPVVKKLRYVTASDTQQSVSKQVRRCICMHHFTHSN